MAKNYNKGKVIGMDRKKGLNAQVNLKAEDLKDIECQNCGCKYFRQVHAFKRVSALVSPTGKEAIVPIQVFACGNCGTIPKNMMSMVENE